MRYAIDVANLGPFADAKALVHLACVAEDAGWDGLFVWDHLAFVWGVPSGDPWVALGAVAAHTDRLLLGPLVTPLPRRRPQVVAHHVATLDVLSGGRAVFGAGLGGVPDEHAAFGDVAGDRERAERLDESLAILDLLWTGGEVTYEGRHHTVAGVTLAPLPVQRPRVPIWIGGHSPAALRRAARWDGWVVGVHDERGDVSMTPDQIATAAATIDRESDGARRDVVVVGQSDRGDEALVRAYERAGATWWLEAIHGLRGTVDELTARIAAGPRG